MGQLDSVDRSPVGPLQRPSSAVAAAVTLLAPWQVQRLGTPSGTSEWSTCSDAVVSVWVAWLVWCAVIAVGTVDGFRVVGVRWCFVWGGVLCQRVRVKSPLPPSHTGQSPPRPAMYNQSIRRRRARQLTLPPSISRVVVSAASSPDSGTSGRPPPSAAGPPPSARCHFATQAVSEQLQRAQRRGRLSSASGGDHGRLRQRKHGLPSNMMALIASGCGSSGDHR